MVERIPGFGSPAFFDVSKKRLRCIIEVEFLLVCVVLDRDGVYSSGRLVDNVVTHQILLCLSHRLSRVVTLPGVDAF